MRLLGKPIVHLRNVGLAITTADSKSEPQVFAFDREGRLTHAFFDKKTFLRGMNNSLLEKNKTLDGVRHHRQCPQSEVLQLLADVYEAAKDVLKNIENITVETHQIDIVDPQKQATNWLKKICNWTLARYSKERERFFQIYKPVGVVPPDQYMALVLQATQGCTWNKCSFCALYRDRQFQIKSVEQFQTHVSDVKEFYASALELRRTIFLGDANALTIPQEHLLSLLEIVNKEFVITPVGLEPKERKDWRSKYPNSFDGIGSFLDLFTSTQKTVEQFKALNECGIRKVYIGLESGSESVLEFVNKPGSPKEIIPLVERLKAANIGVGIIVMAGIGGRRFEKEHVTETIRVVDALPLEANDRIYVSEFCEMPGIPYGELSQKQGIECLSKEEIAKQAKQLKKGLHRKQKGIQVSTYDLREFVY